MKRKLVGILLAVALATLGTSVLVAYVQSAKADATKDDELVSVYVVTKAIRQGATMDEVRSSVELTAIPKALEAAGSVADLDLIDESLVTSIDLRPGEQLLRPRLVSAETLTSVKLPRGLQELTVSLDPARALGADVKPGDTVGIAISFEPFDVSTVPVPVPEETLPETPAGDPNAPAVPETVPVTVPASVPVASGERTPNTTHLILGQVLVTRVQFSQRDSERVSETRNADGTIETEDDTSGTLAPTVAEAPSDQVLVTFALTSAEVEQVVFAAEFGSIWLTAQTPQTDLSGTRIVSLAEANVTVVRR